MEKVSASPSSCHHELISGAMKELSKGLKLLAQLQTLLHPLLPDSNELNLANSLFQDTLSSLSLSLSILQSSSQHLPPKHMKRYHQDSCDLNYNLSGHDHYKRRRKDAIATVTSKPFFDGYQWKKYGQKQIKNSTFQRTYYKCINEACKATKTVQQKDHCEPPNFTITYGMQHTCNVEEINQQKFTMDSSSPTQTFVPIIESNSSMMNKQQEQTSSSTSDQFQYYYNSSEETTTLPAQALVADDSAIIQVSSDDMPKIFSPSCSLYCNNEENERAWMMEEGIRSSQEFNPFYWDGFLF